MPSVRYLNQTAPFWDFVANLEEQGTSHPFFAGNQRGEESNEQQQSNPWTEGWPGFPFGQMPHRGGRHGPPQHPRGPPPPHHGAHPPPPPPPGHEHGMPPPPPPEKSHDPEEGPSEPRGPSPPFSDAPHHGPGPHGGPPHAHHGRCGRPGGRVGRGFGRGGPFGGGRGFGPGAFGGLAEMFQSQIFGDGNDNATSNDAAKDFKPEVDIFDTTDSFVIHCSLPGAKREDVGVTWDSEKSELSIAGVIHRPGDEEFLKTLALDERKVGVFERKVRLGSRANPAQIEVDSISAKMEDGILRITVPKLDSDYVEIKKVDIE